MSIIIIINLKSIYSKNNKFCISFKYKNFYKDFIRKLK